MHLHNLVRGLSTSCGCYVKELNTRHGHDRKQKQRTTEYSIWSSMVQRCRNPKHKAYPSYGGRGIAVCARWAESFEAFLADVGARPSKRYTLDRRDNNRGYEPGNVRWATRKEQQRNRRNQRLLTFNGETRCLTEWAELRGMTAAVLATRLRLRWSVERALTEPVRPTKG